MMALKTCSVSEVLTQKVAVGAVVIVNGWVRSRRDSKAGMSFIALSDGSCFKNLQIIVPNTLANYATEILKITTGCALTVTGEIAASPAAGQPVEIQATAVKVVGWVDDPDTYPIAKKFHTMEYLREVAHLRPRTNTFGAMTRVSNCIAMAIHRFFHERGFYWIHTPVITTSDCEGAGQMLRVTGLDLHKLPHKEDGSIDYAQDFFGRETFLTVSGQLNVEAYCEALSKVYTFGPTFRAENSFTARHLAEFWMIEPEIAFADLNNGAALAVEMLQYLAKSVLAECQDDMEFFAERVDKGCIERIAKMANSEFVHMDYSEAITYLKKATKKFEFPVEWGLDLQSEHERYLTEELMQKPVIVKNYPKQIKSFYMRLNDDSKTVAAMDVLVPGIGEIIGGSQREERYEILCQRMDEHKLSRATYQWYLDLRRYGTVPHVGFGLGFERFILYVTGLQNIRDAIPYPRTTKNAEF